MLEFYYLPEVTGFATQGQTGKVILSFDYDATGTAITTKQQAEAFATQGQTASQRANGTKGGGLPCEAQWMSIDCKQLNKGDSKYVLPGAQPANTDLKTYNAGILNVSTIGQANATLVGELHVKYRCRLEKPILDPAVVAGGVVHFSSISATTANNFNGSVLQTGGTPAMSGITTAANVVTFPAGIPGNYLLIFTLAGATSTGSPVGFSKSGITSLNLLTQSAVRDAVEAYSSAAGLTTVPAFLMYTVTVPVAGGTLTTTGTTITGTGSMDLFIVSLPVTVLTVDEKEQLEIDLLKEQVSLQEKRFNDLLTRLEAGLSPVSAFLPRPKKHEEEECKGEDDDSPVDSGDDLGQSIHIPRNVLTKYVKK